MARDGKVRVGIIGSQFQADIHAASLQIMPDEAEAVAIASPTPGNAVALAKRFGIPRVFTDYREMLKEKDIEMVTIAAPNSLHCQMTKPWQNTRAGTPGNGAEWNGVCRVERNSFCH